MRMLAERLAAEFGKGFSLSNLKSMRQFYVRYQGRIGQSVTGQTPAAQSAEAGQPESRPLTLS